MPVLLAGIAVNPASPLGTTRSRQRYPVSWCQAGGGAGVLQAPAQISTSASPAAARRVIETRGSFGELALRPAELVVDHVVGFGALPLNEIVGLLLLGL